MAKAEEQLAWKMGRGITATAGGTFERFFAIPEGADLNAPIRSQKLPGTIFGTTIPDEFIKLHYTNSGVYGQVQYAKSPRVSLTVGARGDYSSQYGATFNPRVGVVSRLTPRTTLKLLYGTAYLAPSPNEAVHALRSFHEHRRWRHVHIGLLAPLESGPPAAAETDHGSAIATGSRRGSAVHRVRLLHTNERSHRPVRS